MKEVLRDPGLGDFPVACKAGTSVWEEDIRVICGEYMDRLRHVASADCHRYIPVEKDIFLKIEAVRGPFQDLTNDDIDRAEYVDSIVYALLFQYYMEIAERRGKYLFGIYNKSFSV